MAFKVIGASCEFSVPLPRAPLFRIDRTVVPAETLFEAQGCRAGIRAIEDQLAVADESGAGVTVRGVGEVQDPHAELGNAQGPAAAARSVCQGRAESDRRGAAIGRVAVGRIEAEDGVRFQPAAAGRYGKGRQQGIGLRRVKSVGPPMLTASVALAATVMFPGVQLAMFPPYSEADVPNCRIPAFTTVVPA